MGCSDSKMTVEEAPRPDTAAPITSDAIFPLSAAFIIPLDDDSNATNSNTTAAKLSTPNKLPPKRLQKLMEQAATTEPTLDLKQLEEKQNQAELRRKEYLQQKLDNIQKNAQLVRNKDGSGGEEQISHNSEEDENDKDDQDPVGDDFDMDTKTKCANEIKSKALDDDSKQELLVSTLNK